MLRRTATDRGRELRRANGTGPAEFPQVHADVAGGHASGVERDASRWILAANWHAVDAERQPEVETAVASPRALVSP